MSVHTETYDPSSEGWQTAPYSANGGAGNHPPERLTMTWPDPPAPEAYLGLAGDVVQAIEPYSEADPVALGMNPSVRRWRTENPVNGPAQYNIAVLLEMTAALIRGRNRADCPECKRSISVSFNERALTCEGVGCIFRGGIGSLRERLGIRRKWLSSVEWQRLRQEQEQARKAAGANAVRMQG
jgi:hypothetical protein